MDDAKIGKSGSLSNEEFEIICEKIRSEVVGLVYGLIAKECSEYDEEELNENDRVTLLGIAGYKLVAVDAVERKLGLGLVKSTLNGSMQAELAARGITMDDFNASIDKKNAELSKDSADIKVILDNIFGKLPPDDGKN